MHMFEKSLYLFPSANYKTIGTKKSHKDDGSSYDGGRFLSLFFGAHQLFEAHFVRAVVRGLFIVAVVAVAALD